jgi:uncharacterized protein YjiS (DUF1127 family)
MANPHRSAIAQPGFAAAPHHSVAAAISMLLAWGARCRDRCAQRRALAQLDDRLLHDIGLNRTDVARECRKRFRLR